VSSQKPPQQPGWGPPPPRPAWGAAPPPQPPKPSKPYPWRNWAILGAVILVLFTIGRLTNNDTPSSSPVTSAAATSPAAPKPTSKPAAAETAPVSSEQLLRDAVAKELGDSNRNVERLPEFSAPEGEYIVLQWAINENLTDGLTKDGARLDAVKILKAIKSVPEHDRYPGVAMKGSYLMQDKYGNAREQVVIRASYDRATLERMNLDNIYFGPDPL
jgi:hypothetical protein